MNDPNRTERLIASLRTGQQNLEGRVDALGERLGDVEEITHSLVGAVAVLGAGIVFMSSHIIALDQKISAVKDDLTGQIRVVKDDLTGQIRAVRDDLTGQIRAVNDDLTDQISSVEEKLDLLVDRLLRDRVSACASTQSISRTSYKVVCFRLLSSACTSSVLHLFSRLTHCVRVAWGRRSSLAFAAFS